MAKKVPSAGVRLGKSVPGKGFDGAGKKKPVFAKIGGVGNARVTKGYGK